MLEFLMYELVTNGEGNQCTNGRTFSIYKLTCFNQLLCNGNDRCFSSKTNLENFYETLTEL